MDVISWVCGFLAHWWEVFGKNSGQIQTVIGVLAFLLAWKGYQKVLEQMRSSAKLEATANNQRGAEMIIHALNVALNTLDRSANRIDNLNKILELTKKTLRSIDSDSEYSTDDINKLIKLIESKINDSEEIYDDILKLCKTLNESNVFNEHDALKDIYDLLILITNDQLKTDLLKRHYVEIDD
ncbi:hypothetical protein [Acinetobacter rudis]|uniref:hypothetical protein n=1 Tax=Acinetobacter rudis TaxID=632955 RepID=UPI00333ED5B4